MSSDTVVLDRHEFYVGSRRGNAVLGPVRHRRSKRVMQARQEDVVVRNDGDLTELIDLSTVQTVSFEQPLSLQQLLPMPEPQRHRMPLRDRIRTNAKDPAWHGHARRCAGTVFAFAMTAFAVLTVVKCSIEVLAW